MDALSRAATPPAPDPACQGAPSVTKSTPKPADTQPSATTRRQRRAAARRDERAAPHRKGPPTNRPWFKSPIVLLTVGALTVGLVVVSVLQMLPGGGANNGAAAADIIVPANLPPADLTNDRSLGSADAPVTLTVWSDFQCPACKLFATAVEPRLITEYVATGKLRIDYRDLTIIGPESVQAAIAARCAAEEDRFWDYHGVLYANMAPENSGALTRDRLVAFADRLELDGTAFRECLDSGHAATHVATESASASSRFNSTPTLEFDNGDVIAGVPAWDALAQKIDDLVAAAGAG